jgi:hypothetical protein
LFEKCLPELSDLNFIRHEEDRWTMEDRFTKEKKAGE